jgi:hypothetical protein
MTCDLLREAIVDVARGRDAGVGTGAAVEAHIEHCDACRARFLREQRLSEGLRALARSTDTEGASPGVEARVLAAFTERHATLRNERARAFRASSMTWMRVAAVIAFLTASGLAWWWMAGKPRVEDVKRAAIAAPSSIEAKAPPSQAAAETYPPSPRRPVVVTVADNGMRRQAATRNRQATPRFVRPEGFVALPSAEGLPAFDSGEIVRIEVPVTSLPSYGIDIAPDARGPAIEADFLVGQDGQARAIRLVKNGRL